MSYNNKRERNYNKKINTAWYLWSRFIYSPFFLKFNLSASVQSLMIHLICLMDAKLNKYGNLENRKCEIKITEICYLAGMSPKPAMRNIKQLLDLGLIELVQKLPKNIGVYKLGRVFSDWEKLPNCNEVSLGDLAVSLGDLDIQFGRFSQTLYNNTNNKTNNNTDEISKTENQKQNLHRPSPLLEEYMSKKTQHIRCTNET